VVKEKEGRRKSKLTESRSLPLVQEQLLSLSNHDDIPRVDTPRSAHEQTEDGVGSEDGGRVLGSELLDDGIVGRGRVVSSSVDGLEREGGLGVDSVVGLLVGVDGSVGGAGEEGRRSEALGDRRKRRREGREGGEEGRTNRVSGSSTVRESLARRANSISSSMDHSGLMAMEDSLVRVFYRSRTGKEGELRRRTKS